jgi:hypothetical protein
MHHDAALDFEIGKCMTYRDARMSQTLIHKTKSPIPVLSWDPISTWSVQFWSSRYSYSVLFLFLSFLAQFFLDIPYDLSGNVKFVIEAPNVTTGHNHTNKKHVKGKLNFIHGYM